MTPRREGQVVTESRKRICEVCGHPLIVQRLAGECLLLICSRCRHVVRDLHLCPAGAREEILDGETGFLVPVGESKPLADALLTLLQDPERAKQMGTRARQRALELFDEQSVFQRQLDVYERLITRKSLK